MPTDTAGQQSPLSNQVLLQLPPWLSDSLQSLAARALTIEERMRLVLELARRNVSEATGGPFAAAVFEESSGRLYAAGVNLVLSTNQATSHAEMVAILMAQDRFGHYDLSLTRDRSFELVSTTEPCLMCLGAVLWSGVRHLVCGARDADARAVGFDEGPKPVAWVDELRARGLGVTRDVLRPEAASLLREYARQGGIIYNPRRRP